MFRSSCVFCVLLLATAASSRSYSGDIKEVTKSLERCGKSFNMGTCLRMNAISLLDQALSSRASIDISDFLSLAPDRNALENETLTKEDDIEKALAGDPGKKDERLDDMIADRVARYFTSRSLQFHLPADFTVESGRGKKGGGKKGGMMLMAAMAMGGMMMQMAMGKIALLAGKALLVGKMALLLSAIIGLKKLMSGGGGDSHQVVYATESHGGGGHGGGWGRSILDESDAADQLAYRRSATGPGATDF